MSLHCIEVLENTPILSDVSQEPDGNSDDEPTAESVLGEYVSLSCFWCLTQESSLQFAPLVKARGVFIRPPFRAAGGLSPVF